MYGERKGGNVMEKEKKKNVMEKEKLARDGTGGRLSKAL